MMAAHRSASIDALYHDLKVTYGPGIIIGWIRTEPGEPSGHYPDDTPGLPAELQDPDRDQEVRALDPMLGPSFTKEDADRLVTVLVNNASCQRRLYYVIWNGYIWSRTTGWKRRPYGGTDKHRNHVHISGWWEDDENGAHWTLVLMLKPGGTMTDINTGEAWKSGGVKASATEYGEGSATPSLRLLAEYAIEWIRYGKAARDVYPPVSVPGLDEQLAIITLALNKVIAQQEAIMAALEAIAGSPLITHTHPVNVFIPTSETGPPSAGGSNG